jgi:hypothetical protein
MAKEVLKDAEGSSIQAVGSERALEEPRLCMRVEQHQNHGSRTGWSWDCVHPEYQG